MNQPIVFQLCILRKFQVIVFHQYYPLKFLRKLQVFNLQRIQRSTQPEDQLRLVTRICQHIAYRLFNRRKYRVSALLQKHLLNSLPIFQVVHRQLPTLHERRLCSVTLTDPRLPLQVRIHQKRQVTAFRQVHHL